MGEAIVLVQKNYFDSFPTSFSTKFKENLDKALPVQSSPSNLANEILPEHDMNLIQMLDLFAAQNNGKFYLDSHLIYKKVQFKNQHLCIECTVNDI